MSNVEGRGIVAPKPIWVPLTRPDFIPIKERAQQQVIDRDYRNRRDAWGRSHVGVGRPPNCADMRPEVYAAMLGGIGEFGTIAYINKQMKRDVATMDFARKKQGDSGIDIIACGLTMQVKTQQNSLQPGLIRRFDESGNLIPLPAKACVFAWFNREDQAGVWLLGWIWKTKVVALPVVPAIRGSHRNIEVPRKELQPMCRLIKELKQRELIQEWH